MGRRGDHTFDQLTNMILGAAKDLLIEEGFQRISTRKIANRIGYSVGTLYNVFQNLDDIYMHLNGRTLDELIKILDNAIADKTVSQIKSMSYAYIKFSMDNFNAWSLLFEYRFPDNMVAPKWYNEKIEHLYSIVGKALAHALQINDPQKLKGYITVIWAGIHGICVLSTKGKLSRAGVQESQSQLLIDNFIDNYLNGVKLGKAT